MNQPITPTSNALTIAQQSSTGFFSGISQIATSMKDAIVGTVKKHPTLTKATVVLGATLAVGYLAYQYYNSLDKSIDRLVAKAADLPENQCKQEIATFVQQNWPKFGLPDFCNNAKNRKFIETKLDGIIRRHPNQTIELRQEIAKNAVNNFCTFISTSLTRVNSDLTGDQDFRALFNIARQPNVTGVEILGEETHKKGSNPLCIAITIEGEQRIVYKPRSVRAEQLVCGADDSLFHQLELPTYRVYNKAGQDYGYCEYLPNLQAENTFNSIEELRDLYVEFGKIEKVARAIGLSDLHYDNIIMKDGRPHLIDAEVVALPTHQNPYETHLFGQERPGALATTPESKNHIWLGAEAIAEFGDEAEYVVELTEDLHETGMTGPVLHNSGLTDLIQGLATQEHLAVVNFDLGDLSETRAQLGAMNNRIVLVSTENLSAFIRKDPATARENFSEALTEGLGAWGFQVDEESWDAVLNKFEEDLKNNDVPLFYHNAENSEVFYGEYRIGYSA